MAKNNWIKKKLPKIVGNGLNTLGVLLPNKASKIALDVFCKPRGGRIQHYHAKFLDKFDQKDLHLDDIKIRTYYLDKGHQSSILLAHGWESNSARWKKLVNYLEDVPYNIVLLDGPAHGASGSKVFTGIIYADMINVVMSHYRPKVLIGHSIGAFACAFSLHNYKPATVQKFIILASPDKMEDILEQYFNVIGLSKRVRKAFYKNFSSWFPNPVSYYGAANFMTNSAYDGIIIHDEGDTINEYYNGVAINKAWNRSILKTTKGLGHGLQSKDVYEMVKEYL